MSVLSSTIFMTSRCSVFSEAEGPTKSAHSKPYTGRRRWSWQGVHIVLPCSHLFSSNVSSLGVSDSHDSRTRPCQYLCAVSMATFICGRALIMYQHSCSINSMFDHSINSPFRIRLDLRSLGLREPTLRSCQYGS